MRRTKGRQLRHPHEETTLRVRQRASECEIERTPLRERRLELEMAESDALLARGAIADVEELLEARAPKPEPPAEPFGLARRSRRRRRLRSAVRWLFFGAAVLLVLWLTFAATSQPVRPCDAVCERLEAQHDHEWRSGE